MARRFHSTNTRAHEDFTHHAIAADRARSERSALRCWKPLAPWIWCTLMVRIVGQQVLVDEFGHGDIGFAGEDEAQFEPDPHVYRRAEIGW